MILLGRACTSAVTKRQSMMMLSILCAISVDVRYQVEKTARDNHNEVHQVTVLPVHLRFRQHDRHGRSGRRDRWRRVGTTGQRLPAGERGRRRRLRQK